MCNDYQQHVTRQLFTETVDKLDLGLTSGVETVPWQEADDIRVGQVGPVLRPAGNGTEVVPMVFGMPSPYGGRPVINMKSDYEKDGVRKIRDYSHSKRCVIIGSAFYEFKGSKYPKAKYQFTLNDAPFLGVAGIWREGTEGKEDSFAMLTTIPGADIEPIHDRQIVLLHPRQFGAWLSFDPHVEDLLQPLSSGSLSVEQVRAEAVSKRKKAA